MRLCTSRCRFPNRVSYFARLLDVARTISTPGVAPKTWHMLRYGDRLISTRPPIPFRGVALWALLCALGTRSACATVPDVDKYIEGSSNAAREQILVGSNGT